MACLKTRVYIYIYHGSRIELIFAYLARPVQSKQMESHSKRLLCLDSNIYGVPNSPEQKQTTSVAPCKLLQLSVLLLLPPSTFIYYYFASISTYIFSSL
jgi:hypothetical protein